MSFPIPPPKAQLIPLSVAAKILDVTPRTIQKKCSEGYFTSAVKPCGGHWRVDRNEIVKHTMPQNGK